MRLSMTAALVTAAAILAACGGGGSSGPNDPAPGPGSGAATTTGNVVFKLNATTCNAGASVNLRFFISGREVGSERLFGGQASHGYAANAGANEWGATGTDTSGRAQGSWLGRVDVPAGGTVTVDLACTVKK